MSGSGYSRQFGPPLVTAAVPQKAEVPGWVDRTFRGHRHNVTASRCTTKSADTLRRQHWELSRLSVMNHTEFAGFDPYRAEPCLPPVDHNARPQEDRDEAPANRPPSASRCLRWANEVERVIFFWKFAEPILRRTSVVGLFLAKLTNTVIVFLAKRGNGME